ncbi:hypothetical protein [Paremcibacter congregatus]|uniref:hypothetical protein n=1 Tax=Paremcibacter congregatus TaxID=2043170 RepID=UPI003A9370F2|tara:strand:+ start:465 stop:746 length:282 start_codon:yes stop_codon:yes gene_type:complete
MKVQRPFLQVFAVPESELQVFKSCCKKVTFFLFSKISNFYDGMSGGSHLIFSLFLAESWGFVILPSYFGAGIVLMAVYQFRVEHLVCTGFWVE